MIRHLLIDSWMIYHPRIWHLLIHFRRSRRRALTRLTHGDRDVAKSRDHVMKLSQDGSNLLCLCCLRKSAGEIKLALCALMLATLDVKIAFSSRAQDLAICWELSASGIRMKCTRSLPLARALSKCFSSTTSHGITHTFAEIEDSSISIGKFGRFWALKQRGWGVHILLKRSGRFLGRWLKVTMCDKDNRHGARAHFERDLHVCNR